MWTDAQKASLIIGAESADDQKIFLKTQQVGESWFYHMRKKFREEHPEMLSPQAASVRDLLQTQPPMNPAVLRFRDATTEEKFAMIREYDSLPERSSERQTWKVAHGIGADASDNALLTYYRLRMKKEGKATHPTSTRSKARAQIYSTNPSLEVIKAGYSAAADKGAYAAQYNATRQQMWEWVHKSKIPPPLRHLLNGTTSPSTALVPYSAPTAPPPAAKRGRPAKRQSPVVHMQPQPQPARVVTLDDAINVIQVKKDFYGEIVELLSRLKQGLI
jgi:hypothetical protein